MLPQYDIHTVTPIDAKALEPSIGVLFYQQLN